ncbi:MBL fold metallo-hydrolase [Gimesia chilikensis]|uniref:MBL fold metallo-hydrolase n=1 Tax=Gimesia chilikensis TaxID=2605989 RepID=UPI001F55A6A4|nr:MBL fold metallo-hydrolase [Gimesia chilikensis]
MTAFLLLSENRFDPFDEFRTPDREGRTLNRIQHINCGTLLVTGYPTVVCHCLLLEGEQGLVLIDSGIGLADVRDPLGRLGQELIDMAGFQFHEHDTAVRRVESLGFSVDDVKHIVLTHCDPDHTGGLADFPAAQIHVAAEELQQVRAGHWRYVSSHFDHGPHWETYARGTCDWFGLESRPVQVGAGLDVRLIPLNGHTLGHCGVAVRQEQGWLLHVGDAYYLRAELTEEDHPVAALAAQRADDDALRCASLAELRRLYSEHANEIELCGYHDLSELPEPLE